MVNRIGKMFDEIRKATSAVNEGKPGKVLEYLARAWILRKYAIDGEEITEINGETAREFVEWIKSVPHDEKYIILGIPETVYEDMFGDIIPLEKVKKSSGGSATTHSGKDWRTRASYDSENDIVKIWFSKPKTQRVFNEEKITIETAEKVLNDAFKFLFSEVEGEEEENEIEEDDEEDE